MDMDSSSPDAALRETFKVGGFYYSHERYSESNAPVGRHAYEIVEYCDPSGFGPAVRCRTLDRDSPMYRDGTGIVLFSLSDLGRKYSAQDEDGKTVTGLAFFVRIEGYITAELARERLEMYSNLATTDFLREISDRQARREALQVHIK